MPIFEKVESVLKLIQLKPRFFFAFAALGLAILLLPDPIAVRFGITTIRDSYRGWIGIATLASIILWLVQLSPIVKDWWENRNARRAILNRLYTLTPAERECLWQCILEGRQTTYSSLADGTTLSLVHKGLLRRGSGQGSILAWPHIIPDFVWTYMRKNSPRVFPVELQQLLDEEMRSNNG